MTTILDDLAEGTTVVVGEETTEIVSVGIVGPPGAQGPQGADGEDGLGITWRGTWDMETAYLINDAVSYNGRSYIAVEDHTGVVPADDIGQWGIIAQKGANGNDGAQWYGNWDDVGTDLITEEVYGPFLITFEGATYIMPEGELTLGPPPGTPWEVFAAKGEDGAPGADGVDGGVMDVSETPPADPFEGLQWFQSSTGISYVYFDGTWVETGGLTGPEGPAGPTGPEGPEGPAGPAGVDGADGTNGTNGTNGADGADGVSFVWHGEWVAAEYAINDVVQWGGSTWITPGGAEVGEEPGVSGAWELMAAEGAVGPAGADGADGAGTSVEVLDEGVQETAAATSIDFVGSGVSVASTGSDVTVTIDGGGGGGISRLGAVFGGTEDPLEADTKVFYTVPANLTISGWRILNDVSGSITIDVWVDTYANYPPTEADTVTASATPATSSVIKNESTTLTGWDTSLVVGDVIGFNLKTVDGVITKTTIELTVS